MQRQTNLIVLILKRKKSRPKQTIILPLASESPIADPKKMKPKPTTPHLTACSLNSPGCATEIWILLKEDPGLLVLADQVALWQSNRLRFPNMAHQILSMQHSKLRFPDSTFGTEKDIYDFLLFHTLQSS